MNEPKKKEKFIPKGGRKGGAVFPRLALKDAVEYAKKLVSKSHTSPIPKDVFYSGVLGAKSGIGNVKASAVKQYGFSVGDQKAGFSASDLAKKVFAAPSNELAPLLRQAALSPVIFKSIFDTYHGDSVSRAKLKQRAADLNVHPDQAEICVDLYVKTMEFAGLVTMDGEKVIHVSRSDVLAKQPEEQQQAGDEGDGVELIDVSSGSAEDEDDRPDGEGEKENGVPGTRRLATPKAVININVSLDSSMDSEKLAKQLALLRKYGAL